MASAAPTTEVRARATSNPPGRGNAELSAPVVARPRLLELGLGLVVVGCPLAFLPMSMAPFVDVKVAILLAGTVLIFAGRPTLDRRLAVLAAVWVGVMVLAGLAGVDRWLSLAGPDGLASGLILFGPSAYLLVVAASLDEGLAGRVSTWVFVVSLPVASFALAWRLVPGAALDLAWRFVPGSIDPLSFQGATLGHPVLLSGLMAAGVIAAVPVVRRSPRWTIVGVVVLTSALSVSTKRTGLVALAVGLIVVWLRSPGVRRSVGIVAAAATLTLAGWFIVATVTPTEGPVSGVDRFGQLTTDSSRARLVITKVLAEASMERPWLGWGPGNTWSAYMTHADEGEVEIAQRGILDAHDIVLGALVTTGLIGFGAFLALAGVVTVRAARAPSSRGVAAGIATALLVHHLLQPVSAPLTPLLFVVAGIAAGPSLAAHRALRPALARLGRSALGVALVGLLVLSLTLLASGVLYRWGRGYNAVWALRAAVALAPGRIDPVRTLVHYRAEDAMVGDPSAEAEVHTLVDDAFRRHPLFPDVRYLGVDAGLMLNDADYARTWLRRQLEVFPADRAMLSQRALTFAGGGPLPGYGDYVDAASIDTGER